MDQWTKFISHCLARRLDCDTFEEYVRILSSRYPLPSQRIANLFLRPTAYNKECLDPRVPEYIFIILGADLTDVPSILHALLRYSTFRPFGNLKDDENKDENQNNSLRWTTSYAQDASILFGLAKSVGSGSHPKSASEAVAAIGAIIEWTKLLTLTSAADDMIHELGGHGGIQNQDTMGVRVALGALLVALSENGKVVATLGKTCPKDLVKEYSESLALFAPMLLNAAPILAERLELFRTQSLVPLEPVDKKLQAETEEIGKIIDSTLGIDSLAVVDLPIDNSRAGLYVYLNSLLVGRPMVDDNAFMNYLHNRYQGDIQTTCIDLITSSFDVLANAIFRNESAETTIILRSFLINKIPLLIAALGTSMFPPLTPEFCITEALSRVDTNTFPTFSSMFDENSSGNVFADSVRQDFCFACCLHGLIAEESIERLLGEIPMQTLPAGGRYVKDELVQQCLSDPERIEAFLEELENMDGNVGAVSQAITEIIGHLSQTKETMSLKTLCSSLARKPSSLDVMLLFDSPTTVLQPVCLLLDNWSYDEDQGEYQPVYEEFGSILLLVLAFIHRYDLTSVDLGLQSNDSFVAKLLIRGSLSRSLEELSEQEKIQLDGWIRGLFNSEGGGLGDEPMSQCTPQEFYLLVPTLFHQVVLAYHSGYLNDENLKGGLEFLVDTFLLPSLVGALTWLSSHLWESRGDANTVMQILQIIVSPSNEAPMLSSVINITAKPLEHSLRWLQRSEPSRQDVEPLSKALKEHLSFSRSAASENTELEMWASSQTGGVAGSIRHTISSLVQWSLTPGENAIPTSYTHRQILAGLRMLGAKTLLYSIVEEIKMQTANGNSATVFDVAAAVICAPDAASSVGTQSSVMTMLDNTVTLPQPLQHRLTLREALKMEVDEAPKIYKENQLQAETLVRLHRRVEAQMAEAIPMQIPQQADLLHNGLGDLEAASLDVGVVSVMTGAQHIDEAIIAQTDRDMMDALANDGMMDLGGDNDLLQSMNF